MPRTVQEFADRDARAFELARKGVAISVIAQRLGIRRLETISRMIEREQRRRAGQESERAG